MAANAIRSDYSIKIQFISCCHIRKKYGLSVAKLSELFDRPIWEDSALGGNKWAAISKKVEECLSANDESNSSHRDQLIGEILKMGHNTGKVGDKLEKLNQALTPSS